MTVTASAISVILGRAGFKRAARGTHWSPGFDTETFPDHVQVYYSANDSDQQLKKLQDMARLINGRPSKKYWASVGPRGNHSTSPILRVRAYDDTDPAQNQARKGTALEVLATEHPAAPAVADVKKALRTYSQYDADFYPGGYQVERLEEDTRLVRIRYTETSYTTYKGDRDTQIAQTLANYARVVREAGFEFQVRDEEMSVIVGMPGEWDNALSVETVSTNLRAHNHTPCTVEGGVTGYTVSVLSGDNGAVRVQHHPFTDNDEQVAYATVARYAQTLAKAGYDVVEAPDDDWALLVTVKAPEEPAQEKETSEDVRTALLTLRELAEADEPLYSTRRAGDHSVFVMAVNMRLEVFYSDGEYRTKGCFGRGDWFRFPAVNGELLDFLRAELGL